MATKLQAYNGALQMIGDALLSSTSESSAARYHLDAAYESAIDYCLLQANWYFATRTVTPTSDGGYSSTTGWQYRFAIPSDFVRTVVIATDERLQFPLESYEVVGGYLYSDTETLYWSYVSNGASYGGSLTAWPTYFLKVMQSHLAVEVCVPIKGDHKTKEALFQWHQKYLADARSQNTYEKPVKMPTPGRLAQSRGSRSREN